MTSGTDHPPVSPIWAGLCGRCPRCGEGRLFGGFLDVAERCQACKLDLGFADSGDGPAVFIILIAGFILAGGALITEVLYQPPYWIHAALWGPLALILCLGMLRPFKGVLLALQYHHRAEEGRLDNR